MFFYSIQTKLSVLILFAQNDILKICMFVMFHDKKKKFRSGETMCNNSSYMRGGYENALR